MNMILHDNAEAEIKQGNTLADPKFKEGDRLQTFNDVVANQPFSVKRWSHGFDPLNDLYRSVRAWRAARQAEATTRFCSTSSPR
jgi:type I restriction-modification system DNA methylase subunit